MKYLYLIFLLLPVCLAAQQECKLKKTTDPYTKEAKLSTGLITMKGAGLSIEADSKEIDFFFTMDGNEKCFNDASTAVVTYDSTRVKGTYRNSGSVNCDGFFHIIFKNTAGGNSLMQRLITQKITSIQFTGSNKSQIVLTLSPEEQQKIRIMGDCLVKEAKALIK
jgi:hypothetical protein